MSYKSHVVKRALYVRSSRRLYSVRDASDCIGEKIVASAPVYSGTLFACHAWVKGMETEAMRVIILVIFYNRLGASYAIHARETLSCHVGLLSTCASKDILQSSEHTTSSAHLALVTQGFLNQQR